MKRKDFISKACALAAAVFIPLGKLVAKQNDNSAGIWHVLLEYARWCPSPHNVQPWKVKIISAAEAHLYYDPARVPIMVDEHAAFTTAGIGMFLECIAIVARSKGYKVRVAHQPEATLDCSGTQFRLFATMSLLLANETEEISPELIKERRTSRGKYDGRIISSPLTDNFKKIASDSGYDFITTSDKNLINYIIDLNNETELERSDDLPTMNEMKKWVRTSDAVAAEKKDGLWYRCLDIPARTLHNFMEHHQRFSSKWKRRLMRNMLNKGMKGTPNMAWISGPFDKKEDWLQAGAMLQRLWLYATKEKFFMHPLGTIITTKGAKEKFINRTGYNGSPDRLWFLVRLGYSAQPQRSYRLSVEDILIT